MAIVILPDAQAALLELQGYMLQCRNTELWLAAEDDIFAQLAQADGTTFVYAVAGQAQDFQALLLKWLFRR